MGNLGLHARAFKRTAGFCFVFLLIVGFNNCSSQFSTLDSASSSVLQLNSIPALPNAVPNPPQYPPAPSVGSAITTLKIGFPTTQTTDQYVTFGQVFVPGHVPAGSSVTAAYEDGTLIPIQVDSKATHADGSLRHAVITLLLKPSAAGMQTKVNLLRTNTLQDYTPLPVVNLIAAGFDSVITANVGGTVYSASAAQLLQSGTPKTWLAGNMATEWIVSAPLTTSSGVAHPHLTARFLVRAYAGFNSARVSVSVENDYSYVLSPSDQAYTLQVSVGGKTVLPATNITHYNQSRWRKVFYWGQNPNENIQHETSYLLATRALPNYDTTIKPDPTSIGNFASGLTTSRGLMNVGIVMADMEGTGGRPEIGLFPAWTVQYLLSQDPVAKDTALTMGELAGTWQFHYRDEKTDYPVTLDDHPYMTLAGNPSDAVNPVTGVSDAFPKCVSCHSPFAPDTAHQPDFAYVPYLVTGDYFYLEELQFWASTNLLFPNPAYRQQGLGILNADQVRGQAWTLRSVALAAYITPDNHQLKKYFVSRLKNNISFFNKQFTSPTYNKLGVDLEGNALAYNGRGFAPWQDNFFTSVLAMINDLGFTEVTPALSFKTKFPVGLMVDPQFCWILSTTYYFYILPETAGAPYYTSMDELWKNSPHSAGTYGMACNSTQMQTTLMLPSLNYLAEGATDPEGYTAVLQMALSYAVTSGAPNSQLAWDKFMTRSNVANYAMEPQFAIVPRK